MERLWSLAVATGSKCPNPKSLEARQYSRPRCDPLRIEAHGKEGVDGSSPSEGFPWSACKIGLCFCLCGGHADTFRTHLRHARRTAASADPGFAARACEVARRAGPAPRNPYSCRRSPLRHLALSASDHPQVGERDTNGIGRLVCDCHPDVTRRRWLGGDGSPERRTVNEQLELKASVKSLLTIKA